KSVLLLTSNGLLNLFIKRASGPNIDVVTYVEIRSRFSIDVSTIPSDYSDKAEDWIQYEGPERLKAAIGKTDVRYDVLICDEAQDVQPFWWEALETLLRVNGEERFYLFFDRSQGVFGSGGGHRM